MKLANISQLDDLVEFYKSVIEAVNKTGVRLGWDIESYPNRSFIESSIKRGEMVIEIEGGKIIACAVINDRMNDEYNEVPWSVSDGACTIHALATAPSNRGDGTSDAFLKDVENYCLTLGYNTIHLDVIDSNYPAYNMCPVHLWQTKINHFCRIQFFQINFCSRPILCLYPE